MISLHTQQGLPMLKISHQQYLQKILGVLNLELLFCCLLPPSRVCFNICSSSHSNTTGVNCRLTRGSSSATKLKKYYWCNRRGRRWLWWVQNRVPHGGELKATVQVHCSFTQSEVDNFCSSPLPLIISEGTMNSDSSLQLPTTWNQFWIHHNHLFPPSVTSLLLIFVTYIIIVTLMILPYTYYILLLLCAFLFFVTITCQHTCPMMSSVAVFKSNHSCSTFLQFCSWWRPSWLKYPTINPLSHCYENCWEYLRNKFCYCSMSLYHIAGQSVECLSYISITNTSAC